MKKKEIVIKLYEEEYEEIVNDEACGLHELTRAVARGVVLPAGHGELKDTTELQKTFHHLCDAYGIDNISFISDMDMNFDLAPTLVETDKKETGQ